MSMTIESVNSDGMTFEHTWSADVKGLGKAKGMDGNMFETELATVTSTGAATASGNAMFNLSTGDKAFIKAQGAGKGEGQHGMGLYVWSFMTNSKKLAWLNNTLGIVTQDGDPQQFDLTVWELK
jgi:hypothetical protein